jgi:hypothetical protein
VLSGVGLLLGVVVAGLVVWYGFPFAWHFGTSNFSQSFNWGWLKIVPAIFLIFGLMGAATAAIGLPGTVAVQILAWYAEAPAAELTKQVDKLGQQQEQKERELESSDQSGLILLVSYSRMQLQAYYRIGLTQTQRSFRYSIVAMWLGFAVILVGLIYQVVPIETWTVNPSIAALPKTDVKIVAIAGSTVIEVIAALFLWVYRSSITQLTYFYNRQMHIHNVIMCYRMAASMQQPDTAVAKIIDKVLEQTWTLDHQPLPSGNVVGELYASKPA